MAELDEEERRLLAAATREKPAVETDESAPAARRGRPARREPHATVPDHPAGPSRPIPHEPEKPKLGVPSKPEVPDPDNPTATPVQMDYGDPWGLLPIQMRHHTDGRPAF
jgi:hypothetical protein